MEFFCNWKLKHQVTGEKSGLSSPNKRLHRGVRGHAPNGKNFEIFPGSNATNLYVYFVELFSESRYSWSLSRSTKIQDSQVINKDSWFWHVCYNNSWFVTSWFVTPDSWPPIPVYSVCDHLTDAPVLRQTHLMFFIIHANYFPDFDWLKAHA